jgi:hypothetical protein
VTPAQAFFFEFVSKHRLSPFPKRNDTFRILVLAGNVSCFAGDLLDIILEHWTKPDQREWNHIILIPGPREYGPGTVCMGDDRCEYFRRIFPAERLTICEAPTVLDIPQFNTSFVCAPLWPTERSIYDEAHVYEVSKDDFIAGTDEWQEYKTQISEAAAKRRVVSQELLNLRSARDRAGILTALLHLHARNRELSPWSKKRTVVVATYSAPDEQLSTDIMPLNPFRGTTVMGSAQMYALITATVKTWIVGAHCNKPSQFMGYTAAVASKELKGAPGKGEMTNVVSNPYIRKESRYADGFLVTDAIILYDAKTKTNQTKK